MEERKRIRLDDLDRKHPFAVPEGYFDSLAERIQERVTATASEEPAALPERAETKMIRHWWTLPAVAASIALIVGLIWFTLPARQGPLGPDTLSAVSDDAILEYLESQELDYYDLANQDVIQKAFLDESTIMKYLDGVDDALIREQLLENTVYDDII